MLPGSAFFFWWTAREAGVTNTGPTEMVDPDPVDPDPMDGDTMYQMQWADDTVMQWADDTNMDWHST